MKLVRTFGRSARAAAALIEAIERRGAVSTAKVEPVVQTILAEVKSRGDLALREFAERFDSLPSAAPLLVSQEEMQAAWTATPTSLQAAMRVARENIRSFAKAQLPQEWTVQTSTGPSPHASVKTGQIIRPLASVGCYVPGGRYPLPSTLLMTVTPAQVAGVGRIVVCSPRPARETMAAAWLAGVTEFYRVGGAQAIAAMAFGTATIAAVDKIVGPGNLFVTAAKKSIADICGIDMPAGPTEIVVISETGAPQAIAADLVAQAEHDPEALAVFITSNATLATAVLAEVKLLSASNPIAEQALRANGRIFVTSSVTEAQSLTNRLAPEHLSVDNPADLKWIRNAGSVFVGPYAPQAMGDYISGPNHVLPTGRVGRIRGGLSVLDFLKIITVQQYTRSGLQHLGPYAIALAEAEGLVGHAESVRTRMRKSR